MTPVEFSLLELLMRRAGDVVTRAEIQDVVFGRSFYTGTNQVSVLVSRLRRKIHGAGDRWLLHTVRGAGYVMEDRAGESGR